MSEWKELKIEDFCEVIGGGTPSTKEESYYGGNISWITPRDLTNYKKRFILRGERNITELGLKNSSARILPKNSILLTSRAPIGYLAIAEKEVCTNQGFKSLIINPEKADYNFVYYLIKSNVERIKGLGTGTTFAEISGSVGKNLRFSLPDLPTQSSIAEILSSLDDKIELNNKINQELETLAQALFKQWFVDFEFPNENGEPYKSSGCKIMDSELGEIPEGWEIKRLKEILNIKRGGSPRPIHDYMASSGLPWVKISDATALNNPFLFSTKEFIKVEGLRKTILLKKGSLILSNSATPGLPKFLELDACIHDGWLHFQDVECVTYNFLYLLFLYIRVDLVGQGNGSIFINLKTDILKEYAISIPNSDVMEKFSEVINPIFETIKNNASENIKLTNLRDYLLPKLISGELEINENKN